MPSLIHLIYASAARPALGSHDLAAILDTACRANTLADITGMLLHVDGSFFQVLEGDAEAVDSLFAQIQRDGRHTQTTCIIREPLAGRAFQQWSMGYAQLSIEQVTEIAGANDFFSTQHCLDSLNPGRARKLLMAFASGRWRTQLRSRPEGTSEMAAVALK